ncbi:unnamed protein product [Withania somnifera]
MKNNRFNDDYNSSSDDSMVLQEPPKNDHNLSMDATLQILGTINGNSSSPSSTSPDWKLDDSKLQENLNSIKNYQQENGMNCPHHQELKNQDFNYYSDLLQTLFDSTDDPHGDNLGQTQQSLFANNNINPINYVPSSTIHRQNSNDFVPSLPKPNIEEIGESTSSSLAKNRTNQPTYKRPRIETPSPLPSFKVRKEKLGDRITALQQLVSPFGKTDTASVLQEAIEYINFLHDQVNVLSTSSMKNESTPKSQQEVKEVQEGLKQSLRSKGLCLVPISNTFPVAAETTMDFWTPTLGRTLR